MDQKEKGARQVDAHSGDPDVPASIKLMCLNMALMNDRNSQNALTGALITLSGAALWGLNAVVSKFLMTRGLDTIWMMNFRMITSGLVLLVFVVIRDPGSALKIWKDKASVAGLFVIAAFAFGMCQMTYYLSIEYSNAGIAAALQQTAPVFVFVYVMIRERRKPYASELITLPLVIAGSFLIATRGDAHALAIHPLALIFGLISAVGSAMYITLPAPLIKRYGTMPVVGWGLFLGGCMLAPFCGLWEFPADPGAAELLGLAFIILPGSAMAFALFLYGTTLVGPVRGGIYNLFEPVVAVTASAILLGQSFHITEIVGIAAILAGITILTVSKEQHPEDKTEAQAEGADWTSKSS